MARGRGLHSLVDAGVMLVALAMVIFLFRDYLLPRLDDGSVTVIDGDSLRQGTSEIRLHGIDAPEYRQSCTSSRGVAYACGKVATEELRRLVGGRDVACKAIESDRYGRVVALCTAGKTLLNEEMVRLGWAVAYTRHATRFVHLEAEARTARRGIWQGPFEPPESYRSRNRDMIKGGVARLED